MAAAQAYGDGPGTDFAPARPTGSAEAAATLGADGGGDGSGGARADVLFSVSLAHGDATRAHVPTVSELQQGAVKVRAGRERARRPPPTHASGSFAHADSTAHLPSSIPR